MTTELDNTQDVIDSRDVIARIAELQELADAVSEAREAKAELQGDGNYPSEAEIEEAEDAIRHAQEAFDDDLHQELAALKTLAEEAEGYSGDWQYGAALIRDSYFTDYARELLEDCGDLPKDLPHYIHIDWEATARDIRMDYTAVDFDGVTYWIR